MAATAEAIVSSSFQMDTQLSSQTPITRISLNDQGFFQGELPPDTSLPESAWNEALNIINSNKMQTNREAYIFLLKNNLSFKIIHSLFLLGFVVTILGAILLGTDDITGGIIAIIGASISSSGVLIQKDFLLVRQFRNVCIVFGLGQFILLLILTLSTLKLGTCSRNYFSATCPSVYFAAALIIALIILPKRSGVNSIFLIMFYVSHQFQNQANQVVKQHGFLLEFAPDPRNPAKPALVLYQSR